MTSRPNTDNTDVEKLQLATFDKSHALTRNHDAILLNHRVVTFIGRRHRLSLAVYECER